MTIDYHDMVSKNTPREERRALSIGDIWINAARCKECGDSIRSKNRRDYRTCSCGSISVDGGSWYAKRTGHSFDNVVELFEDVEKTG